MEEAAEAEAAETSPNNQQVRPPLLTAALIGDEETVIRLLAVKVPIDQEDFAGCTAVQLASAAGHLNIVKLLLDNGAKPEKQDSSHGNTSLHEAAWRGYSQLVKLVSSPASVDKQNHGGFTALHLSCQAGHNQSTRELLLASSDPNIVNTYGDTPLHTAVRYGHAGVARILLSARAGPDVQNKNGDSPLHIASAMGRKKLTKILLATGCKTTSKNHQNELALDIAVRKNFNDIIELFKRPPAVVSPIQRDEIRASKVESSGPSSTGNTSKNGHIRKREAKEKSDHSDHRKSGDGSSSKRRHFSGSKKGSEESPAAVKTPNNNAVTNNTNGTTPPAWSPYGCHYHPNPDAFPPPKIDSLPHEPLKSGELYFLDLAGNIRKGPVGKAAGCYCTQFLRPASKPSNKRNNGAATHSQVKSYEEQLHVLTSQLAKIHLDTQAQLTSLQAMLNEKLTTSKTTTTPSRNSATQLNYDENKLKDWVRQYRRFRKDLSKNPKALVQANELLENASALMLTTTTPTSPPAEESADSDSGL